MQGKNQVMLTLAFSLGIGSAVASSLYLSDVYVKGRFVQGGMIRCINTLRHCQSNGTNVCVVKVPTSSNSGLTTASTSGPYRTYLSDCEFLLTNTSDVALYSDVQTYDLISDSWP